MSILEFKEDELPLGNGGGTCKTIEDVENLLKSDALSLIEIGSITVKERHGNTGNTFYSGPFFTLNSLGLPNPGLNYYEKHLPIMVDMIHEAGKEVIANVVGFSTEEYALLAKQAFNSGVDLVSLNYGCPNVWVEGEQKDILSYDLESMKATTSEVLLANLEEAKSGRIGIKLSPMMNPSEIKRISRYLNSRTNNGGPDIGFITTMNTIPNSYYSEKGERSITPANGLAGMAGPGVLPMALGQVMQFRALLDDRIKIIGVGGVNNGQSMQQMIAAGADAVQVTSAYYKNEDPFVFQRIGIEYVDLKGIEV